MIGIVVPHGCDSDPGEPGWIDRLPCAILGHVEGGCKISADVSTPMLGRRLAAYLSVERDDRERVAHDFRARQGGRDAAKPPLLFLSVSGASYFGKSFRN